MKDYKPLRTPPETTTDTKIPTEPQVMNWYQLVAEVQRLRGELARVRTQVAQEIAEAIEAALAEGSDRSLWDTGMADAATIARQHAAEPTGTPKEQA